MGEPIDIVLGTHQLDELCRWMRKRHVTRAVFGSSTALGRTHIELELGHEPGPEPLPPTLAELQAAHEQIQKDLEEDLFASSEGISLERLAR